MELDQLQKGDVLSVAMEGQLFLAMYLGRTSPLSSSHMAAHVSSKGLTVFDLEKPEREVIQLSRYHDKTVANNASARMRYWLMQHIPYDETRHLSEFDQDIQVAKNFFSTIGFFNVVKFAARDFSNHALTQLKCDAVGKGLRMPHIILLAFQLHFFKDKIVEQENRFSFKEVGRNPNAIHALLKSDETNYEVLPESLRIHGKYLTAENLLSHLNEYAQEWLPISVSSTTKVMQLAT